jgi:hypothetical protein
MKVLLAALVAALAIPALAVAAADAWVPGTSYYIEESDLSDALEKRYDSAYCDGIARFGKRGEFPYEKFRVFDCTTEIDDDFCFDKRIKTVKAQRVGWYRWVMVRPGSCY